MLYDLKYRAKWSPSFEFKPAYWPSNVDPKCEVHFQRSSMMPMVYALLTCRFATSAYVDGDTLQFDGEMPERKFRLKTHATVVELWGMGWQVVVAVVVLATTHC